MPSCLIHAYMDRASKSARRVQAEAGTLPSPQLPVWLGCTKLGGTRYDTTQAVQQHCCSQSAEVASSRSRICLGVYCRVGYSGWDEYRPCGSTAQRMSHTSPAVASAAQPCALRCYTRQCTKPRTDTVERGTEAMSGGPVLP